MANMYDDSKFGVIERNWFFLRPKWGGAAATGYEGYGATKGGTTKTVVTNWYPRGPIKMLKAGRLCMATLTNASSDLHKVTILTRGASASTGCTFYAKSTATAVSQKTFASTTSFTVSQVKAGEYVTIKMNTPTTDKATVVAATTTGTLAFFIDWVRTYGTTKWDM